jgi:crossover junction endodeoxyribonuclease RuvC
MKYIGIDPGKTGAVAILSNVNTVEFYDCPLIKIGKNKTALDFHEMATILDRARYGTDALAIIEKVSAMPGQGVTSMFSFGTNFGAWQGILAALQIPYELTTPQAWKKAMMAGQPKDKDASRGVARQLFPLSGDGLKLKKHDGRADALLMAEFLRRKLGQGSLAS